MTDETIEWLKGLTGEPKVVAIGEIGLDYYYDEPDRELQKKWFIRQLEAAKEKYQCIDQKYRDQTANGPCHISKEGRHLNSVFLRNGTNHKVRCVTNVCVGTHKYGTAGNCHQEVAVLFIGIFITMIPALLILKARGSELGIEKPWQFFWMTGFLSSFLDNTPTYLVFFTTAVP